MSNVCLALGIWPPILGVHASDALGNSAARRPTNLPYLTAYCRRRALSGIHEKSSVVGGEGVRIEGVKREGAVDLGPARRAEEQHSRRLARFSRVKGESKPKRVRLSNFATSVYTTIERAAINKALSPDDEVRHTRFLDL